MRMSAARFTTTRPTCRRKHLVWGILIEQPLTTLHALKLLGMATALNEKRGQPDLAALSSDERLALELDREQSLRHDRQFTRRLQLGRPRRLVRPSLPLQRRATATSCGVQIHHQSPRANKAQRRRLGNSAELESRSNDVATRGDERR